MKVFDGHNDTLTHVCSPNEAERRPFLTESEKGHVDILRAVKGGLAGGFFAICPPGPRPKELDDKDTPPHLLRVMPDSISHSTAREYTLAILENLRNLQAEAGDAFRLVRTFDELSSCIENDIPAMVLHFEGAEAIDTELNQFDEYYGMGLRSLGLVWSRINDFGHGVPFAQSASPDTGPGLTRAGFDLVKACNEKGVLIDLSHINAKGFQDVANTSTKPLVASHSSVFRLSPSTRNLTDDQIKVIGDSNGIIGINFHVGFLRDTDEKDEDVTMDYIVRHADYIAGMIGIEHVGFGSDFDGATMPSDLGDVSNLPLLIEKFRQHGYDEDSIEKLAYRNWLRVIRDTWA